MPAAPSGTPLTAPFAVPGGSAQLFTDGLAVTGGSPLVGVAFDFPMIGRPSVVTGDHPTERPFEPDTINFQTEQWSLDPLSAAITAALDGRLGLVALGHSTPTAMIVAEGVDVVRPAQETGVGGVVIPAVYGLVLRIEGALQDRQLYGVAVQGDAEAWHVVAPHALYFKQSWTDFGLAHISDMHVARRIDSFRGLLAGAGRAEAAAKMINWNDRFRGFIRYANFLHSTGALDAIVATGDLYDYIYEDDDDPALGGNAAFLRQLLLGQAPGPEFPDVEELRVPIFMVPGNHDYRKHPYKLIFDAQLRVEFLGISKDVARIKNFHGYHMRQEDAQALAQLLRGGSGTDVQNEGESGAARMVEVDELIPAYKEHIADRGSYLVRLGAHRIAMIDSGHDVGIVDDTIEALRGLISLQSEDETTFVGGSPNCEGVQPDELAMAVEAMREASTDGLVMVGLHAPLFNVWNGEYPYYLRETQRPEQGSQAHAFLARHNPPIYAGNEPEGQVERRHPNWFPGDRDHRDPRFVVRVDSQDYLDYGVSRGKSEELMRLLAGADGGRPADVVLAGHTHRQNEFSVRRGTTGELFYSMDFYTENPARMYPTRYTQGWITEADRLGGQAKSVPVTGVTYVEVVPGADPDQVPWGMPYDAVHGFQVQVPPYATPLSTAADPKAWWDEHRPLVLQTGALGPLENSQVSFTGFRLLAVKGNVIQKIHFISTEPLEASQYRMALEDAVRVDPPRQHLYVERSRPLGSPSASGAPSGISFHAIGVTNAIYRDGDGRLHELWQKGAERGTSNLTALADNATPAASNPYTYLAPHENLLVALYRGTDNHVHSVYWNTGAVGRDALSGPIGAPPATGNPVGHVGPDATSHVYYRAENGHVIELWWSGAEAPGCGDLTKAAGAEPAVGDPSAYNVASANMNIVVYRGDDNHIHSFYWTDGEVGHDGLSAVAGSPEAKGDPVAYYTPHNDAHQVVYRGHDGHLYELWWNGVEPVQYWDLTANAAGAPPAASDPTCYYSAGTNTKHVIYRSEDGHLHDIAWRPGGGTPAWTDLSVWALAPLAQDKPSAYTVEGPNTHHVVYRGMDDRIHELRWTHAPS